MNLSKSANIWENRLHRTIWNVYCHVDDTSNIGHFSSLNFALNFFCLQWFTLFNACGQWRCSNFHRLSSYTSDFLKIKYYFSKLWYVKSLHHPYAILFKMKEMLQYTLNTTLMLYNDIYEFLLQTFQIKNQA